MVLVLRNTKLGLNSGWHFGDWSPIAHGLKHGYMADLDMGQKGSSDALRQLELSNGGKDVTCDVTCDGRPRQVHFFKKLRKS